MDLSALGITKEELIGRIVDKAVEQIYEDGGNYGETIESAVNARIKDQIKTAVDEVTERIGKDVVEPRVAALIEEMTFQETNSWGEPKKPPKTWREMLIERAENWLTEKVNHNGKTKAEDSYSWSPNTTRISYMVNSHLQYEIKTAMGKALADANGKIASGIADAVKISLAQVLERLKVEVKA